MLNLHIWIQVYYSFSLYFPLPTSLFPGKLYSYSFILIQQIHSYSFITKITKRAIIFLIFLHKMNFFPLYVCTCFPCVYEYWMLHMKCFSSFNSVGKWWQNIYIPSYRIYIWKNNNHISNDVKLCCAVETVKKVNYTLRQNMTSRKLKQASIHKTKSFHFHFKGHLKYQAGV